MSENQSKAGQRSGTVFIWIGAIFTALIVLVTFPLGSKPNPIITSIGIIGIVIFGIAPILLGLYMRKNPNRTGRLKEIRRIKDLHRLTIECDKMMEYSVVALSQNSSLDAIKTITSHLIQGNLTLSILHKEALRTFPDQEKVADLLIDQFNNRNRKNKNKWSKFEWEGGLSDGERKAVGDDIIESLANTSTMKALNYLRSFPSVDCHSWNLERALEECERGVSDSNKLSPDSKINNSDCYHYIGGEWWYKRLNIIYRNIGKTEQNSWVDLLKQNDPNVLESATISLGVVCNREAVTHLLSLLSKTEEIPLKSHILISLCNLGCSDVVEEVLSFLTDDSQVESLIKESAFIALMKVNNELVREKCMQWIIGHSICFGNNSFYKNTFLGDLARSRVLGDYASIILRLIMYIKSTSESLGRSRSSIIYQYTTEYSNKAIDLLAILNTPISNNMLHLLTNKKDIRVLMSQHYEDGFPGEGHTDYRWGYINYDDLRSKAMRILAERGNPLYDSSIFMDTKNWYL